MAYFNKLGIHTMLSTKIISTSQTSSGQTEVICSDGTKILTDLYVPTFGVIPNSSYIPSKLLNADGFVMVDEFLKVKGTNDIWAVGDISDMEWTQWIYMNYQAQFLGKNFVATLKGKAPASYKNATASNRTYTSSLDPCSRGFIKCFSPHT